MMINGSLLKKIFLLIGTTLLLSALLTLCIYIAISNKIYVNSRIADLTSIGRSVVDLIDDNDEISIVNIKNILDSNMNFADTKIEIYDESGNTYMIDYKKDIHLDENTHIYKPKEKLINIKNRNVEDVLKKVLNGAEVVRETSDYIFAGFPVYGNNKSIIGAVILTKPKSFISYSANNSLYLTLILSTLGVFLIMLFPAYLIVKRIIKPIKQMTNVANAMSKGDFSKRADEEEIGEVGELARAINTCAKESEKLENTRRDYVANVSHELRTPISAMRVIGETLKDGLVKDEKTKQKYYDNIVKESVRLSTLVNDLLELSRLQSGNFVIEKNKFNISEILCDIEDVYKNISIDKKIDFIIDKNNINHEVFSNSDKIEQVLIILIDNAFKHTANGSININVEDKKEYLIINVIDSGCGISLGDIDHIFERFYKADKSHSSSGSGLGLSIASEILEIMNEKIWVQSKVKEGSKFSFTVHKYIK